MSVTRGIIPFAARVAPGDEQIDAGPNFGSLEIAMDRARQVGAATRRRWQRCRYEANRQLYGTKFHLSTAVRSGQSASSAGNRTVNSAEFRHLAMYRRAGTGVRYIEKMTKMLGIVKTLILDIG